MHGLMCHAASASKSAAVELSAASRAERMLPPQAAANQCMASRAVLQLRAYIATLWVAASRCIASTAAKELIFSVHTLELWSRNV